MVIRWLWFVGQLLDSLYSMCPSRFVVFGVDGSRDLVDLVGGVSSAL